METLLWAALVAALILFFLVRICIARAARARLEARRAELLRKYMSVEEVDMIMNKTIWTGMSADQLLDCLGRPESVDEQVMVKKRREVWKYGRIGENRYSNRVTVEQGVVVRWSAKGV